MMNNHTVFFIYVVLCALVLYPGFSSAESLDNEVSRAASARTMLEKITSSLLSKSGSSTSQVLSLNLSNLLILILLKALIFAAGSIGAGGWKGGYGHGRSVDEAEEGFITDTEILLYLGYLSGAPGKHQCLQNVACNRPQLASQYSKAGGLLLKAARLMPSLNLDSTHEQTLTDLKKAAEFGEAGGNCDMQYICANRAR